MNTSVYQQRTIDGAFSLAALGPYGFYTLQELSSAQLSALFQLLRKPEGNTGSALGGRTAGACGVIDGLGRVHIKQYARGGVLRHLVDDRFLRLATVRSRLELDMLLRVRELGVHAPKPIGYVINGGLFYRTWLVTEEIQNTRTLVDISLEQDDRVPGLIEEVIRQLIKLMNNQILHVDFHPGNVLVDENNRIYFVDFDKAKIFKGDVRELRNLYLRRWRRAVIKHRLPEVLNEVMCLKLRANYE